MYKLLEIYEVISKISRTTDAEKEAVQIKGTKKYSKETKFYLRKWYMLIFLTKPRNFLAI